MKKVKLLRLHLLDRRTCCNNRMEAAEAESNLKNKFLDKRGRRKHSKGGGDNRRDHRPSLGLEIKT